MTMIPAKISKLPGLRKQEAGYMSTKPKNSGNAGKTRLGNPPLVR